MCWFLAEIFPPHLWPVHLFLSMSATSPTACALKFPLLSEFQCHKPVIVHTCLGMLCQSHVLYRVRYYAKESQHSSFLTVSDWTS